MKENAPEAPQNFRSRILAMMNGRGVRSYLVRRDRNGEDGGSQSIDGVPSTVQFDESSDEYRCLCNCFHIKTGTYIIAVVHMLMILFFFVHTLLVYFEHDSRYYQAAKIKEKYVFGSFLAETIGLGIAFLAVLLLLLAVSKNIAPLLIPHIVVQVLAIICFLLVLISGIIAVCTDTALFYRLMNAAPFREHPNQSTVRLDTTTTVRMYSMMVIYAVSLILEVWFIVIIYNCYRYLQERSAYMRYCLAFSTPMKTLSAR
ncbi:unnamed protein product, partial [Mesorhabditis belari]|uniref:Lysosomal-associated transmembrane protein n=1 Tax=Mesorhabditis belari TaxID=2138241 RepID=A0AAF3ERG7_9BILA